MPNETKTQKKPIQKNILLPSHTQILEEIIAMRVLLMDLAIELKKTRSWVGRLDDRVSELERKEHESIPNPLLDGSCSKTPNGVALYGKQIPLHSDVAEVFCCLANTDGFISLEDIAIFCTPKNKRALGEHPQSSSIYQRLRRLKEALNTYRPNLWEQCIEVVRKERANVYRFNEVAFRKVCGIR